MDVKADSLGNLYIADTGNNRVRKIDAAGNITTAASDLNFPNAIAISPGNELYIVDWQNYVIRKLSSGPAIAAGGNRERRQLCRTHCTRRVHLALRDRISTGSRVWRLTARLSRCS